MLAPILPRPIMPTCIWFGSCVGELNCGFATLSLKRSSFAPACRSKAAARPPHSKLCQCFLYRLYYLRQILLYIFGQVDAQGAAAALRQDREIAAGLRGFY